MAVWRRKPKQPVLVHSDQGSQFTGGEWQDFLKAHNLSCGMSRRGNCHDNAVAGLLSVAQTGADQAQDYATKRRKPAAMCLIISRCFTNPIERHGSNDGLSPVEFERQFIFNNKVSRNQGRFTRRSWLVGIQNPDGVYQSRTRRVAWRGWLRLLAGFFFIGAAVLGYAAACRTGKRSRVSAAFVLRMPVVGSK